MIDFSGKSLLVIAPHPDDEVIGCSGLIQHVKAKEGRVYVIYLTVADTKDFSGRGNSTTKERIEEIATVSDYLGFDGWRLAYQGESFHLNMDQIPQHQIINEIETGDGISLEASRPDILAFPSFGDYNQDHRAAAEACFAACRPATALEKHIPSIVLSYEAPMNSWNHPNTVSSPNLYISLTATQAEKKAHAMNLYASQVRAPGHPRHSDTLKALAQLRGAEIGLPFAEAFKLHRMQVRQEARFSPTQALINRRSSPRQITTQEIVQDQSSSVNQ